MNAYTPGNMRMPKLLKVAFALSVSFTVGLLMRMMVFDNQKKAGMSLDTSIMGEVIGHGGRPKVNYIPNEIGEPVTFKITFPPKYKRKGLQSWDETKSYNSPRKNVLNLETRFENNARNGPAPVLPQTQLNNGHASQVQKIPMNNGRVSVLPSRTPKEGQNTFQMQSNTDKHSEIADFLKDISSPKENKHSTKRVAQTTNPIGVNLKLSSTMPPSGRRGRTLAPPMDYETKYSTISPPIANTISHSTYKRTDTRPVANYAGQKTKEEMYLRDFYDSNFLASYHTKEYELKNDKKYYMRRYGKSFQCLVEGTDDLKTQMRKQKECACKPGWYGDTCTMPSVVWNSNYPYEYGVQVLQKPRRIIYAMPFNHEFDLLEAKVHELHDVVDVFLILESNYSASGQVKERKLKDALDEGFLPEFQDKIVYVSLDYFPREGYINGWAIDALLRNYIGYVGLEKILKNVRQDDIFVSMDADEIPMRESLLFLKLHVGYPEPVGFQLRHNIFGFYWMGQDMVSEIHGAVSIALLQFILNGNVYDIRKAPTNVNRDNRKLDKYRRKFGGRIKPWSFGSSKQHAGWHCSWCFTPKGIRHKMLSAHASDNPRWGSILGKTSLPYLENLRENGIWFDGKKTFIAVKSSAPSYAPMWLQNNPTRFSYLLQKPVPTS